MCKYMCCWKNSTEYRQLHKERCSKNQKEGYEQNKATQRSREYQEKHKEDIAQRRKEYHEQNK